MERKSSIQLTLQIRGADGGRVLADLRFTNSGTEPHALLSWLAFREGRIDADRFLVGVNNIPAKYIGLTIKRRAPGPNDFIWLKAGESVESTVTLSDSYQIVGPGTLAVRYEGFNPSPDQSRLDPIDSNTATMLLP
jgi:hypothetical protein